MHIYFKSLFGLAFIFAFGANLYLSSKKEKEEFISLTGRIDYLDKTYQQYPYPASDSGKYYYLKIDNYQKVFEIYKNDSANNKKNIDRINQLKLGDTINIFFDENVPHSNPAMGERVIDIEKNKTPYYYCDYTQTNKIGGLLFISFSIILLIILTWLKYIGKIS